MRRKTSQINLPILSASQAVLLVPKQLLGYRKTLYAKFSCNTQFAKPEEIFSERISETTPAKIYKEAASAAESEAYIFKKATHMTNSESSSSSSSFPNRASSSMASTAVCNVDDISFTYLQRTRDMNALTTSR